MPSRLTWRLPVTLDMEATSNPNTAAQHGGNVQPLTEVQHALEDIVQI